MDIERLTKIIDLTISSEPMERRLYPDLYAEKVAKAIAKELEKENN